MSERPLAEVLEECTERCRTMDAPLAVRLQSFANDVRRLNDEFADVVERMVLRLRSTNVGDEAPKPGEPMPDFMLPDQSGRLVVLSELIENGPVAIAFHRGHWCPYCRIKRQRPSRHPSRHQEFRWPAGRHYAGDGKI
jgi:hypothetical protein